MANVVIGYSSVVRPGTEIDESQIQAPSNYKNKEAIDGYKAKMKAKMIAEAGSSVFSSELERVVMYRGGQSKEFNFPRQSVIATDILGLHPSNCEGMPTSLIHTSEENMDVFCFNPHLLRHLIIMDSMDKKVQIEAGLLFPSMWERDCPAFKIGGRVISFYDPVYLISGLSAWETRTSMISQRISGFAPGTPECDVNSILSILSKLGIRV